MTVNELIAALQALVAENEENADLLVAFEDYSHYDGEFNATSVDLVFKSKEMVRVWSEPDHGFALAEKTFIKLQ